MASCIDTETIKAATNNIVDIATFTAIGHFCCRYVNHLNKSGTLTSFIGKLEIADLKSAAVCCAIFVTIDRLAQKIITAYFNDNVELRRFFSSLSFSVDKTAPIFSVIRIAIDTVAAVTLFNLAAPHLNMASMEMNTAAVVISTAIVVYGLGHFVINSFNNRP